ncbi:MAG: hypothetical protein PHE61_05975 [Candidatus Omnitrophica bacterium]|nr:hypothetical protein [Candidatus Omnitrophota bacterium]
MNCLLSKLCSCSGCNICPFCIQITIAVLVTAFGLLVLFRPKTFIDMQIVFYRLINWKVEPVSMPKELRNTRLMGAVVFILGIVSIIYLIVSGSGGN